jgi:hypothetical protein
MSLHDYRQAHDIGRNPDNTFASMIMAAAIKADKRNSDVLKEAFPAIWNETEKRFSAPGGRLPGEEAR